MRNILIVILFLSCSPIVNATIVDHGDYLSDDYSGLDWLDINNTFGLSYDYVSSQLGDGGLFEGWRYATGVEFGLMRASWLGLTVTDPYVISGSGYMQHPDNEIDGLISILGGAYFDSRGYIALGIIDDTYLNGNAHYIAGLIVDDVRSIPDSSAILGAGFSDSSMSSETVGSFLVRNTASVPEPETLVLFGASLFPLWILRRRKNWGQNLTALPT